MEVALTYLGFKARTEQEVRQKLLDGGFTNAEETITKLKEWKYLDDEEFAKSYIRSRSVSRPQSSRMLAFELKKKGLTTQVAVDDIKMAKAALSKKPNLKTYQQRVRFLASRGFSWETIGKVLKNRV